MAFIADHVLDAALAVFDTEADRIDICSAEPATYAEATATLTLGNKTAPVISAPADASPNGRKVSVSLFEDGAVTATGTATHYAIVDTVNTRLLATGPLSAAQVVTAGNAFALAAFDISVPDAQ